jgi:hypothetical protein
MPKPGDGGLDLPDSAFAPQTTDPAPSLDVDPQWLAERAAKQAAASNPPKPRRQIGGVIVAVFLIAAVAAAIAWFVSR